MDIITLTLLPGQVLTNNVIEQYFNNSNGYLYFLIDIFSNERVIVYGRRFVVGVLSI